MRINVFKKYGPLNSAPVFDAFIKSLQDAGEKVFIDSNKNCDVAVIWSVLWMGRMSNYKAIYESYKAQNKPVIVLEVGGIKRNETWKIGINGVNREADFANQEVDSTRWDKFKIKLAPWRKTGNEIIICGQHHRSHQWRNNPSMQTWIEQQITKIRQHTNKPIIVRPHPRNRVLIDNKKFENVRTIYPIKDVNTYDDTDFTQKLATAWAVLNHSSNPAMQSVFAGVPVFVSESSLSYDVGNIDLAKIENPVMPDRQKWLNQLSYTEWWTKEIEQGLPWKRIKKRLEEKYV